MVTYRFRSGRVVVAMMLIPETLRETTSITTTGRQNVHQTGCSGNPYSCGNGSGKADGGDGDLWVPFGKGGGGNRDGGGDDVDPETLRETASITTAAIVTIIIITTSKSISTGGTRDASGWKARTSG